MITNPLNTKRAITEGNTSLGIEFGSTRIKTVLINNDFEVIASGSHEWENHFLDGYWTYSLADITAGMQAAYREMAEQVEKEYGVSLQVIGSIGISGMMHGYMAFDHAGELLTPFRTWRSTTTGAAAGQLTDTFQFNIPERWSIAHLYQAVLNEEEHLNHIDFMTTLSGYIHWLLTGTKAIGIGEASGMFPIDVSTQDYNDSMMESFDELTAGYTWNVKNILPPIYTAGEQAGTLTAAGAGMLDVSKKLQPGIPFCPPEGDAGTGMVATNSVRKRTGNVSVGTSVFAMIVLEKELQKVLPEIDLVTTPAGSPVGMIHANNCSSDLNAWLTLFKEFYEAMGQTVDMNTVFEVMLKQSLEAEPDGGGMVSYGYFSGETITGFQEGRPLFVRSPESNFNLANVMRVHLYTAFAVLKIGMDILAEEENIAIDKILAHGGLFKTPLVGQRILAAVMNAPVSVMKTAGEGGAWGSAVLASYMRSKSTRESLEDFLDNHVFEDVEEQEVHPDETDVKGFETYMKRYKKGLAVEQAAVDHIAGNGRN
ncbi:sugar (pentulose or hexulose) kinase [Sinobaca qinghaiensis]|uniref:Sugar (Pentulose or hexulose) kinase n=1 Tax=Sinobaca qinghaiensis TaxID=342944 RepID=A0A419V076_9BACL|nr:FGGY-family carbohydrate kinase [Sinobaca qinghaiensis]RKD71352.1 sugar (pentulose or hexulose) kinase [Sinobaca qinghaiensis]